ncbi:MAG: glycosyltransferase family 2 protein [Microgenomates group bacterium]|nr:glycosyltransferase family 2 protein [Microgenomates group bacterium]
MATKTLSIIIPVYNEEKFIGQTIERVLNANCLDYKKEIIIIDDGSTDRTRLKINQLIKSKKFFRKNQPKIIFIIKKKNEGKGAALKTGFLKSTGDVVLIQDADLEYNPDDYPILLEPFKNGADVVYGSRFISNRPHRVLYFWHSVANIFLTFLSNMFTNINLTDMETGFKVFRGDLIRKIARKLTSKRFGFEPEITARIAKIKNLKIYEVGISYRGRTYEEGKKIGWKDGIRAIYEIIRYNLFN